MLYLFPAQPAALSFKNVIFPHMPGTAGPLPSPPGEHGVDKAQREPQKGPSGPSDPSLRPRGDLWEMPGRWPSATAEPLRCERRFICMPKW